MPVQSVFGYLGPNGAGKTTAIRLLAGLIRSRAGRAEVLCLDSVADRAAVQRFDLDPDLDLGPRIGTLSHGNKQKIGIVQAFMHSPELFILDEPTAGLDPIMQREFLALVRERRSQAAQSFSRRTPCRRSRR